MNAHLELQVHTTPFVRSLPLQHSGEVVTAAVNLHRLLTFAQTHPTAAGVLDLQCTADARIELGIVVLGTTRDVALRLVVQQRLFALARCFHIHITVDDPHVAAILVVDWQLNAHARSNVAEHILVVVPHEIVGTCPLSREQHQQRQHSCHEEGTRPSTSQKNG